VHFLPVIVTCKNHTPTQGTTNKTTDASSNPSTPSQPQHTITLELEPLSHCNGHGQGNHTPITLTIHRSKIHNQSPGHRTMHNMMLQPSTHLLPIEPTCLDHKPPTSCCSCCCWYYPILLGANHPDFGPPMSPYYHYRTPCS